MKNKIFKKNEANAGIIVLGLILLIAVVTILLFSTGESEYWETPWDENAENESSVSGNMLDGMWQDEFYVIFEDGSEESLKLIGGTPEKTLAVRYNNKVIERMGIRITASISGSGYTGAELKFESFGVKRDIKSSYGVVKKTYNALRSDTTIQVPMGKTQDILTTEYNLETLTNSDRAKYPNGQYKVGFLPLGTVKYRGYPDGDDWVTASLPPLRFAFITVMHSNAGLITVTLGSGLTSS